MGNAITPNIEHAQKTGVLQLRQLGIDEFPKDVLKLSNNLRTIDFSSNKIRSVPPWISNFLLLKQLILSNNRLVDLPEEIVNLKKLEILTIDHNQLRQLPHSLSGLTNLKSINASNNKLQQFPIQLCQLPHLDVIDLSQNKITVIPNDVGHLRCLELNLNQNQISQLSEKISECGKLKVLRLEENCLALSVFTPQIMKHSQIAIMAVEGNVFQMKDFYNIDGYEEAHLQTGTQTLGRRAAVALKQRLRFRVPPPDKRPRLGRFIGLHADAGANIGAGTQFLRGQGHLLYVKRCVAELCRQERIELPFELAKETRLYAERLLQEAMVHGEESAVMLEMAHFWLAEPPLVQKLFSVLVPRFMAEETAQVALANKSESGGYVSADAGKPYVMLYRLPGNRWPLEKLQNLPPDVKGNAVLEIRGNPWPPVAPPPPDRSKYLINILVSEARREFRSRIAQADEQNKSKRSLKNDESFL